MLFYLITKDTLREKTPSNKTPALQKVRKWMFGMLVYQITS